MKKCAEIRSRSKITHFAKSWKITGYQLELVSDRIANDDQEEDTLLAAQLVTSWTRFPTNEVISKLGSPDLVTSLSDNSRHKLGAFNMDMPSARQTDCYGARPMVSSTGDCGQEHKNCSNSSRPSHSSRDRVQKLIYSRYILCFDEHLAEILYLHHIFTCTSSTSSSLLYVFLRA